jgi:hypothetical protein
MIFYQLLAYYQLPTTIANYHCKLPLQITTTTTTNPNHSSPPLPTPNAPSRSQLSDAISDHETSTAMKVSLTSELNASRNALSSLKQPQQQQQLIHELQQQQQQQRQQQQQQQQPPRSPDPFGTRTTSNVGSDDAFDALVTTSSSDGNFAKQEKDTKDKKEQQEGDMGLPVRLVVVWTTHWSFFDHPRVLCS